LSFSYSACCRRGHRPRLQFARHPVSCCLDIVGRQCLATRLKHYEILSK
jgi:hypothetical protein